jgi:hypothetical protein
MSNELPQVVMMPNGQFKTVSKINNMVGMFPDKRCKKCFGRGWSGKYVVVGDEKGRKIHMICKCVKQEEGSLVCGIQW